jgi:glycerol-3-phosphate responsive antiterminator
VKFKKKKEGGVKRKNEIKISRYTGKVFTLLFVQKKNKNKKIYYYLFLDFVEGARRNKYNCAFCNSILLLLLLIITNHPQIR